MKPVAWLAAVFALLAGIAAKPSPGDATLIIGGGTEGYLAPCGCVKPMTGGITRRATAVRQLKASRSDAVYLEMGPFAGAQTRQHEIKAETVAQILNQLQPAGIALGREDAELGPGMIASLHRLSGERLFSSQITGLGSESWPKFLIAGPFYVGALDVQAEKAALPLGVQAANLDQTANELVQEAGELSLVPIVLLQGDLDDAKAVAKAHPQLRLIAYRHEGNPPSSLVYEGETALVTPGDKGKHVLAVTFRGGKPTGLRVVTLGPENADDPDAARLFTQYKGRVRDEKLLEMLPRVDTPGFAGSKACQPCHAEAWDAWVDSDHAHALKTLEDQGHDRDPDCVSCHVVGLDSVKGFQTRQSTPDLADVGCESCHGPGGDHSVKPMEAKMPKIDQKSCQPCHTSDHSPTFDFDSYWPKIAHGPGGKTGG